MVEPTHEAKQRACDLANAARIVPHNTLYTPSDCNSTVSMLAFAEYVQQVSDAAKEALRSPDVPVRAAGAIHGHLAPFILPEPVDPVEVLARQMVAELDVSITTAKKAITNLVAAGLIKIVETNHG